MSLLAYQAYVASQPLLINGNKEFSFFMTRARWILGARSFPADSSFCGTMNIEYLSIGTLERTSPLLALLPNYPRNVRAWMLMHLQG